MKQVNKNGIASALGAVVLTSMSSMAMADTVNPFGAQQLESGYMQVAPEGKCGEGKCGESKKAHKEGKCGEGKCGAEKKAMKEGKCGEGKCGGDKKAKKEGKCGEGKCGGAA